jgi:type I restriction enzyme S subunit
LKYDGKFDFSAIKYVPKKFAASMSKGQIQSNDILVVKDGATTGKTAFVDSNFPFRDAVVNEHVFVCRPTQEIEPRFLFRFLMSMDGQERILENFQGSAQGGINQSFAPNTEVPLAPLNEQRRIVAKLEKILGKVDACHNRLEKIPSLLKRFRQSVLATACSGQLTENWREGERSIDTSRGFLERVQTERLRLWSEVELGTRKRKYDEPMELETPDVFGIPNDWAWATVDALSTRVADGVHRKPEYVQKGVPFLTVRNLTAGPGISFENVSYIREEDHLEFIKRTNPEKGDVLVTKDGTLGVVRVVDTDRVFSIFVSLALIKPVIRNFGRYLALALSAPQVNQRIVVTGTGLQHIHLRDLRAVSIPIPPESEQQEIVRRVDNLFALADNIEQRYKKAQAFIDKLTPSLLAKAFRGELVPQDPNDEPASVLLERIKGEREQKKPQSRKKR